jgi:hypothetical protein
MHRIAPLWPAASVVARLKPPLGSQAGLHCRNRLLSNVARNRWWDTRSTSAAPAKWNEAQWMTLTP